MLELLPTLLPYNVDLVNQVNLVVASAQSIVPAGPGDPTWFDNPAITREMLPATLETLAMTVVSSLFTVLFGLPVGLFLVSTAKTGLTPNATVNRILGFIVNLGRSLPFLILAVFILSLIHI